MYIAIYKNIHHVMILVFDIKLFLNFFNKILIFASFNEFFLLNFVL